MKPKGAERGQATIEFLIAAIVLFTVFFAVIQFIVLMYTYVIMAQAAKEGVRYAIVHGNGAGTSASGPTTGSTLNCSPPNVTNIENTVKQFANFPGMTIQICYLDGNNAAPNRVSIKLSYPFVPIFRLAGLPGTVYSAAEGRISY